MSKSPLARIPTVPLLVMIALTVVVAYWLAWRYRRSYDPQRLIRGYVIYAPVALTLALLLQVQLVLAIGIWLAGAGVLATRSNHYFYEHR
ncbi:hypothetical protein [Lacticaseibacillus camelliae]|uniref:Uncharacterized protein n=1 Tax=Lacticaseibacillus camelliae DSM 22697 = JCM 13995 TaxID=1423730 RepID=A0A0R2FKJ7_9LACO|nr:hypothetical protein [Lacticaseibacillus camelliae]KRN25306.1 hypothetical protein FC75_GL000668 [Lacticaseibacillus camelliae DSM 22697 = JCM 13995]